MRRLADGRIAAVAKFARSGCYTYSGAEVGRPDLGTVTVYRPEDEVFSDDAMASFAHKAITLDHPSEGVTAANWKSVSVGFTEGRVARDGGFIEIPLMLADASAVAAYDSGRARELSAGYSCELVWGDGVAPDGTPFQAKQTRIRGNHIAQVPAGRAGSDCRIGDSMTNDANATTQSIRDAAFGKFRLSDSQKATIDARAAAEIASIENDPRKAWQQDDGVRSSKAVRDAALAARYR
ncbi:DUF2213 domain-containing protein [Sphingobium yanoikuyae]|uniref:DUF2213 domain-containing protein n=1 Tax=Sphingobium yanoikuyae TaxID=13690 RepID=UPI00211C28C5|nr:DUF2213 domain-containing protein [Sphingobium yanoikuyae]WQE06527.1 DUF2213 domain-containing protein [Sphingobium yanoikuyae]